MEMLSQRRRVRRRPEEEEEHTPGCLESSQGFF